MIDDTQLYRGRHVWVLCLKNMSTNVSFLPYIAITMGVLVSWNKRSVRCAIPGCKTIFCQQRAATFCTKKEALEKLTAFYAYACKLLNDSAPTAREYGLKAVTLGGENFKTAPELIHGAP